MKIYLSRNSLIDECPEVASLEPWQKDFVYGEAEAAAFTRWQAFAISIVLSLCMVSVVIQSFFALKSLLPGLFIPVPSTKNPYWFLTAPGPYIFAGLCAICSFFLGTLVRFTIFSGFMKQRMTKLVQSHELPFQNVEASMENVKKLLKEGKRSEAEELYWETTGKDSLPELKAMVTESETPDAS